MNKEIKNLIILASSVFVIFLGSFVMMGSKANSNIDTVLTQPIIEEQDMPIGSDSSDEIIEKETFKAENLTGLLIGFDKSKGLTDVLMVTYFDSIKNEVKLISVPRDLHIDFREEPFKTIKEEDPNNKIGYCKMGEVYLSLGKTKDALKQVEKIVSAIVGLEIDYMATIDIGGFRDVVDVVGGVEFYVPQRMKYNDAVQDLHIDLQEGLQLLDGDHAEQLVRFRRYITGDLQRIQVQQDFIVELYKKIIAIRDFDKLSELVTVAYGIFDSDFGLAFVLQYAQYIFELDKESLLNSENMVILPSYGETINEVSYQLWDLEEMHEVVKELIGK